MDDMDPSTCHGYLVPWICLGFGEYGDDMTSHLTFGYMMFGHIGGLPLVDGTWWASHCLTLGSLMMFDGIYLDHLVHSLGSSLFDWWHIGSFIFLGRMKVTHLDGHIAWLEDRLVHLEGQCLYWGLLEDVKVDTWTLLGPFWRAFGGHRCLHQAQHSRIVSTLLPMWIGRPSPRGFVMVYLVYFGVFSIILLMWLGGRPTPSLI